MKYLLLLVSSLIVASDNSNDNLNNHYTYSHNPYSILNPYKISLLYKHNSIKYVERSSGRPVYKESSSDDEYLDRASGRPIYRGPFRVIISGDLILTLPRQK